MNPQFNQPKQVLNVEGNKQSIARIFGIKQNEVAYLNTHTAVDTYSIVYEKATQTCWYSQGVTGTPTSWTISLSGLELVTTTGTFNLSPAVSVNNNTVISPVDFGAKGDELTDDTEAVNAAQNIANKGQKIDGQGKTFLVTALPDISRFNNARFKFDRIVDQPLYYISDGYLQGKLIKITDTPNYNAWPQDKAFVYDNVIYCPYMAGERHGVSGLHVAWVRSGDDGQTWTTPEWLTDLHPNYPTVNYHCMSMGVMRNRLFAMIETRTLASNALVTCELWDRPMSRNYHPTGGITKAANQPVAVITIPEHGLFAGDFVNFSNSGVTGVSGNMTVTSVIDRNTFTVTTPNQQAFDQNNSANLWHMGTSFHQSPWRKTSLGLIPSVTEVHSFTAIDNNSFVMGYHQGDVAPREVGIFYFPDPFNNPSTFIRRHIPAEYEPDAAEPCVKYFDGVLYLVTRGTRSDRLGSSLHRSNDIGVTWESLRFPNNVHHSTLPFTKIGNELILFGTERAFGEWEALEADKRYSASYPRTFYTRVDLTKWDLSDTQWVNITDQIYQGGIVNSGTSVGSVVQKDGLVYYMFGGEDHFNPWTYGDNAAKDAYVHDGHPPDLYCYILKIGEAEHVSREFTYGATPNRAIPSFIDTDGKRTLPAPLKFTGDNDHGTVRLGNVTLKATTSSNIRSELKGEGEYMFVGKTVPAVNSGNQRVILAGGDTTSSASGAQITLFGSNHTTPRRLTYNAVDHYFQTGDVKPYNDNNNALGSPGNRWTTAYLTSNPIVTSDGDYKTKPVQFDEKFFTAWADVQYIMYRWLDRVEAKGNEARIHFGVIAQQIRDTFIAHGLMSESSTDCKYAVLCYDAFPEMIGSVYSHDEEYEVTDADGNVTIETKAVFKDVVVREAGNEWGVRPDGIFFAEAAYQRHLYNKLESRLAALEAK